MGREWEGGRGLAPGQSTSAGRGHPILRPLVPPRRASPSRHQGTAAGALQRVRAAPVEVGARDAAQPGARGLQKNVYV